MVFENDSALTIKHLDGYLYEDLKVTNTSANRLLTKAKVVRGAHVL